ncbi:uncharacterized protein LOC129568254 [Sitodiplosis mosellana]|uniref:uncharacterized protein LOC129568254 n=1 Tax=Sitodiplosis mosellana TaxID=263140 RepID=UPI0024452D4F|nr:uncharacterized protein LOC129568254 [Sitodiplosis mosellana]XP_055301902.1 uncharacterized protein LOC129568254 [Sitodiplosis mosellana]
MSGEKFNSCDFDLSLKEINQLTSEEESVHTPRERNIQDDKEDILKNDAASPAIFKLDIDCFHEIFDWLQLHDVTSFGRTCKRLQQVAGDFYRSNYVSKRIIAESGGYILYHDLNIFTPYIEKISICGNNSEVYDFVGIKCKSIREIRLGNNLPEDAIERIKNVLKKVEVIEMNECTFRQEFYEYFLKQCPKLKKLSVKRSYKIRNKAIIIGSDNDWLLRKYPTLEHIELTDIYEFQMNELNNFFELNHNVRSLSIDSASLEANQDLFLSSNTKLEKLTVEFSSQNLSKPVNDLLAQLHERNFFKHLLVYFRFDPQENLEQMFAMPFSTSLESLNFEIPWPNRMINIDICSKNLKVLGINNANKILNIEALPRKLPNLEKIYFGEANPKEIWPFICGSVKLKTIKILNMVHSDGIYSFSEFPDVQKMNEKRKMLAGARKVVIYICERLLLVSKWAKKATNLDLIELRRFESIEWNDLNSHFRHNHSKHYF